MFAFDDFSILKVIDGQNTLHIPKYEGKTLPADICVFNHFGRLSPAAVHSVDSWFDSGVKWWIHVSSNVTYLCKNSFLLHWNSCKLCFELLMRCCFWLAVGKCGTHFQHFQYGEYTAFWYFQLLCYLMQLQFMISQNELMEFFLCFPGQLSNLGDLSVQHHLCLLWPHLKSAYHLLTIVSNKVEWNNSYLAIALLELYFFSSESNSLSTQKIKIFPLF